MNTAIEIIDTMIHELEVMKKTAQSKRMSDVYEIQIYILNTAKERIKRENNVK